MTLEIQTQSDLYKEIIEACYYILHNDSIAESARAYLNARVSREIQKKYRFGFFPRNEDLNYLFNLVDREKLLASGLLYKTRDNDFFVYGHFSDHNVIMPFYNDYDEIISVVGRTICSDEYQKDNGLSKYRYTKNNNKSLYVFGLSEAREEIVKRNCVICVEGQFDQIACAQAGIKNVVATGTARLSSFQLYQLTKYTDNIIMMFDRDDAGKAGNEHAKKRFSKYANVFKIAPPKGSGENNFKDIDEFLSKETDHDLKQFVLNKLLSFNYSGDNAISKNM